MAHSASGTRGDPFSKHTPWARCSKGVHDVAAFTEFPPDFKAHGTRSTLIAGVVTLGSQHKAGGEKPSFMFLRRIMNFDKVSNFKLSGAAGGSHRNR